MKMSDNSARRGREGCIPISGMVYIGAQALLVAASATIGYVNAETLVLIAVLGVLMGIAVKLARHTAQRSARARAQNDLQIIRTSLEEYRLRNGEYPRDQIEFDEAVKRNASDWYEQTRNNDPWGTPYEYRRNAPLEYRLWSQGL